MKKQLVVLYSLLFFSLFSNPVVSINDFFVDKTEILVGIKIHFTFSIHPESSEEYSILTEEFFLPSPAELLEIQYLPKQGKQTTEIKGIFSIYESGEFQDLFFQVPVSFKNGEVINYRTNTFSIKVSDLLTKEEKAALKEIKDTASVELRPELPQEKFRFYFEGFLLFALIVLLLTFLSLILYRFLLKKRKQKKGALSAEEKDALSHLTPFEKFTFIIENLQLESENRKELELKLSMMSGALKELIHRSFHFNATSETTRELLSSMRKEGLDDVLVSNIAAVFQSMDMVKFARADINKEVFQEYRKNIKSFGYSINQTANSRNEKRNENI